MTQHIPSFIEKTALNLFQLLKSFNLESKIEHFGLFGSCIYSDKVEDIDIVLILKNRNKHFKEILELIEKITQRIHGYYDSNYLLEYNLDNAFIQTIELFQLRTRMDIDYGIGPASLHIKRRPWIHLNGPMSITAWNAFVERFPIHGQIIANNYVPIIGGQLPTRFLRKGDITQYVKDMKIRFRTVGVSPAYCRKLVKTAAFLAGETSCDLLKCLQTLRQKATLSSDTINHFESKSDKTADLSEVCFDLLSYIESNEFNLLYE